MVLINMANLRTGGGISILENFTTHFDRYDDMDAVVLLVPHFFDQSLKSAKVVRTPRIFHSTFGSVLLNFLLPVWIWARGFKKVLNFGDLPIPTAVPQGMVIDWPYALYPDSPAWQKLSLGGFVVRKLKLYAFRSLVRYVDLFLPQTESAAKQLSRLYGITHSRVIPNSIPGSKMDVKLDSFGRLSDPTIFYITHYYPHKNIEILIDAVKRLNDLDGLKLVLTLDPSDERVQALMELASDHGVSSRIINLGPVPYSEIDEFYKSVDILVMPSLLESFSSAYIEAFGRGLPVLTSDLEFAHAVCGTAALYFDPSDPEEIADCIRDICENGHARRKLVTAGFSRLDFLPRWDEVIELYSDALAEL